MVTCCRLLKVLFLSKSLKLYGTGFPKGQQEVSSEYSQLGKEAKQIHVSIYISPIYFIYIHIYKQLKLNPPLFHRETWRWLLIVCICKAKH